MIKKWIGSFALWVMGWKIELQGDLKNLNRCVLVVAPHTTNWEFVLGILAYWKFEKPIKLIIKDAHTKAWYGWVVRKLGGIGINRSQHNHLIEFITQRFKEEDFSDIPKETKNFDDAKQRFLDYKNGKFNWDIVTFANKGEKLSKIYSKSKKLMTIFSELYLEYMDDITNFDFLSLKSYGFKTPQIEEFIQKRDEYYKECRI